MFAVSVGVVFGFLLEFQSLNFRSFSYSQFFFVCGNNYTYLECVNKGEPIEGGCVCNPPVDVVPSIAAVSGWRKFRRWSTRSWCCVRHLVRISGSDSSWSWEKVQSEVISARILFAFLFLSFSPAPSEFYPQDSEFFLLRHLVVLTYLTRFRTRYFESLPCQ